MGGAHGVVNTIKVLDLLWEGGNVAEDIANEQGGTAAKAMHLMQLVDELAALPGVDWAEFKAERGEYDSEDWDQIMAAARAKFELDDNVLEAKIEEGLILVREGVDFVKKARAYVQTLKTA